MELVLAKLLGILLGTSFAVFLLGLSRRGNSAPLAEQDGEAGDYVFQVSPDGVTPGKRAMRFPLDTRPPDGEN